jgi:hypothetical protein
MPEIVNKNLTLPEIRPAGIFFARETFEINEITKSIKVFFRAVRRISRANIFFRTFD